MQLLFKTWMLSVATVLPGLAQEPGTAPPDGGEQDRPRWQQRWREIRDATPEQRREMRLDWMVSMLTRTYELSEEQQTAARQELRQLTEQYREDLGPKAADMDQVRDQMRAYWIKRMEAREAGRELPRPSEDPEFQELRGKFRDLMRDNPFDWPTALQRVERMLPPEQAAKGRRNREEWLSRQDQTLDAWRERTLAEQEGQPPDAGQFEKYTRDFISRYALDGAQTRAAQTILSDLVERERLLRRTQAEVREEVGSLPDAAARAERAKALDEPLVELFQELKRRLDSLLTEKQRAHPVGL
jgi:hypothetical protein